MENVFWRETGCKIIIIINFFFLKPLGFDFAAEGA